VWLVMKFKQGFDVDKFNTSKNKKWGFGNNVLYDLCRENMLHEDCEKIRAKLWLIGRSYAVAVERRREKRDMNNNDFYDYVVEKFVEFNKDTDFDKELIGMKDLEFDENGIKKILKLHGKLTNFFKDITGLGKRSLASKYLHFHNPMFPIYDSIAKESLNKIVEGNIYHDLGDKEYAMFCYKILFLYNYIKSKTGDVLTLRDIDSFLIESASEN